MNLPEKGTGSEEEQQKHEVAAADIAEVEFSDLFQYSPVGQIILNRSGIVIHANYRAEKLLGIGIGSARRNAFTRFISRADIPAFFEVLRDCDAGHLTGEIEVGLRRSSAAGKTLRVKAVVFPRGAKAKGFSLTLDPGPEGGVEESAQDREIRRCRELLDSIEALVWEADAETLQRTWVSRHAERLLGYSVKQWTAEPQFWVDHIYVGDREPVLDVAARAIADRHDFVCEYRMITANREIVWLRDRVRVVQDGRRLALRGVAMDITEQKRAWEQLHLAQASLEERVAERTGELERTVAELESFSYTLSHDMRAPLRAMHGFAEILAEKWGDRLDAEAKDHLFRIEASARRLDALIQDVLKYSKVNQSSITLHPVDVEQLLRNMIAEYPSLQAPAAEVEILPPLHKVRAHEGFLTQCFSNLLSNAVKFVPPGATPHVRISSSVIGRRVQLELTDNGIGIAPKDQRRIFRIFQRVQSREAYEGTGVGLAIVQRAAERMGGQVGVESTPGQGSKFWIQLQKA